MEHEDTSRSDFVIAHHRYAKEYVALWLFLSASLALFIYVTGISLHWSIPSEVTDYLYHGWIQF